MKIKITTSSPVFTPLNEMYDWAIMSQDRAEAWIVDNLGSPKRFYPEPGVLFGSIGLVRFDYKPKPKNWRPHNRPHNLYRPHHPAILESLSKLPRVTYEQFQKIIGYAKFYPTSEGINHVPGLVKGDGYFLINVPDDVRGYVPLEGMTEILGSEYNRLHDEAEAWRLADKNA